MSSKFVPSEITPPRLTVMLLAAIAIAIGHAADAQDAQVNDKSKTTVAKSDQKAAFKFSDVEYFHRFSDKDLHEYTPDKQEDLDKFSDMLSINYYRSADDEEKLATAANTTLERYKEFQGKVLQTKSVPRTKTAPAEHLIVVIFARTEMVEIAFARFRMHEGMGTSIVYSHRFYGVSGAEDAVAWLKKNGSSTEKALMAWNSMPKTEAPSKTDEPK